MLKKGRTEDKKAARQRFRWLSAYLSSSGIRDLWLQTQLPQARRERGGQMPPLELWVLVFKLVSIVYDGYEASMQTVKKTDYRVLATARVPMPNVRARRV